ncbi:MAG: ATP-dependent 6-phosphofructokinase [Prevotellaceae bacterium]|jgi:6-phosphofructokinase 1|nr:ATP-dependent 6-phosphofructokinase [Prevotellaceae bacterium]
MKKRVLLATGGGDCPGLNAVIRGFVKRAHQEREWEVLGSIQSFNGLLEEPTNIRVLDPKTVSGIHVRGGTIIGTTNKGGPFAWPVRGVDGTWEAVDRSDEMIRKCRLMGIDAVVNIGGDGSQRISQKLFEKGLPVIGVPKTIDNDLEATDYTFGFHTAVQIATDALDKLVTTAESHNRILIMEVMGRDAGWIALNASIAGGAEVCLIPEIPYSTKSIMNCLEERFQRGKYFAVIVISEGAKPVDGAVSGFAGNEVGYENFRLVGAAARLSAELKAAGLELDIRETVLGHVQRGGTPVAYDRILAAQFGVKAFEMVRNGEWGYMVAYRHPHMVAVPLSEAINRMKFVDGDCNLIRTARGINICLGD